MSIDTALPFLSPAARPGAGRSESAPVGAARFAALLGAADARAPRPRAEPSPAPPQEGRRPAPASTHGQTMARAQADAHAAARQRRAETAAADAQRRAAAHAEAAKPPKPVDPVPRRNADAMDATKANDDADAIGKAAADAGADTAPPEATEGAAPVQRALQAGQGDASDIGSALEGKQIADDAAALAAAAAMPAADPRTSLTADERSADTPAPDGTARRAGFSPDDGFVADGLQDVGIPAGIAPTSPGDADPAEQAAADAATGATLPDDGLPADPSPAGATLRGPRRLPEPGSTAAADPKALADDPARVIRRPSDAPDLLATAAGAAAGTGATASGTPRPGAARPPGSGSTLVGLRAGAEAESAATGTDTARVPGTLVRIEASDIGRAIGERLRAPGADAASERAPGPAGGFAAVLQAAAGRGEPGAESPAPTASFPVTVPFDDPRFGNALSERVTWLIRQGLQGAELTLNPKELGPIRIEIALDGGEASLGFTAAHADTRAAIEQALPRLREMLAGQGLQLGGTLIDAGAQRQGGNGSDGARGRPSRTAARDALEPASTTGTASGTGMPPARGVAAGRVDLFA
jgi:flagellar hook-length control protein FliK